MRRLIRLIAISLSVVAACALVPRNGLAGTATSRFIILHASPDAPNVDVYANGQLVAETLAYGSFDGVFTVPSADYAVQMFATGADPSSDEPVINQTLTLEPGGDYTLIAAGNVADLSLLVLLEPPLPGRGSANVRVVHLTPNAPAIDLVDEARGPVVAGVAFKQNKLETLRSGAYVLSLRVSGTSNVLEDYGPATLRSRANYTAYYLGAPVAGRAISANKRVIVKTFGRT